MLSNEVNDPYKIYNYIQIHHMSMALLSKV